MAEGELFNNPAEWRHLITEQLIDYIRVHISQIGGITPARKLAVFAEQFGVKTAWHGPGDMTPIAHAANVHIDLAAPNFGVQEWSGIEPPNVVIQDVKGLMVRYWKYSRGCLNSANGYVYPNDQPGIRGRYQMKRKPLNILAAMKSFSGHRLEKWMEHYSFHNKISD